MKPTIMILLALFVAPYAFPCAGSAAAANVARSMVFAAYAEDGTQLGNALVLVESVRTFGGEFKNAPIWIYAPGDLMQERRDLVRKFVPFKVPVEAVDVPTDARGFPYASKVFAAERAEERAKGRLAFLIWMDDDTVVLREPAEFVLAKGKSLGCRPVMHQNIGSLYSEAPDPFWSLVYRRLEVGESALFPMKTVADGKTLRPYFNAGLLVVRPERGIMARWARSFTTLYRDPALVEMCKEDARRGIFLHQAALAGAIGSLLDKSEIAQLSDRYNYPIFFNERYGADREFNNLNSVVTLRHDVYFQKPAPGWDKKLKGPTGTIAWLKEKLGSESGGNENASTKMRFRFQKQKGEPRG